jgi:hypothetical protein
MAVLAEVIRCGLASLQDTAHAQSCVYLPDRPLRESEPWAIIHHQEGFLVGERGWSTATTLGINF